MKSCPKCGRTMVELFYSSKCDTCDPPRDLDGNVKVSPVVAFNDRPRPMPGAGDFIDDEEDDDDDDEYWDEDEEEEDDDYDDDDDDYDP